MSTPRPRRPRPKSPRPRPERAGPRPSLRFRRDGTFTIVQLTDVHWTTGRGADERTRDLIEGVLEIERPDLVVFTGDVVSGEVTPSPDIALREATGIADSLGIPWTLVLGNHDDEGRATRLDLLAAARRLPFCLAERGPAGVTGVGNHVLRVRSSRSPRLALALYFLDSRAYDALGFGHYDWIRRDQIAWYMEASGRLKREFDRGALDSGRRQRSLGTARLKLPALAFFHIPLPEWDEVWRTQECRGHRQEPVCSPALNSGFFAAMAESGDVMGAFCGHDHLNDYEGELHGIRLCYGRATGFGEYGKRGFPRGARVVRLREGQRGFETWIRVEGGRRARAPRHTPEAWRS
jgi:Calcineurin-like phosphoesterase